MYELDILCGISKVPFKIPHKILKDVYFVEKWRCKSSHVYELVNVFEKPRRSICHQITLNDAHQINDARPQQNTNCMHIS